MSLKNSTTGYGWVAVVMHWLLAIALFGMFGLGLYMIDLSYYDSWYRGSLELHKSIGMTLVLIWVFRLYWRLINTQPESLVQTKMQRLEHRAALWVHRLFYLLVFALMLSGYLISTADGRAIDVFGLVSVPALPWSVEGQEDIAGEIHEWLAWIIVILAGLHAAAAIKHQFLDKDNTLGRMLKPCAK